MLKGSFTCDERPRNFIFLKHCPPPKKKDQDLDRYLIVAKRLYSTSILKNPKILDIMEWFQIRDDFEWNSHICKPTHILQRIRRIKHWKLNVECCIKNDISQCTTEPIDFRCCIITTCYLWEEMRVTWRQGKLQEQNYKLLESKAKGAFTDH